MYVGSAHLKSLAIRVIQKSLREIFKSNRFPMLLQTRPTKLKTSCADLEK
jgi:hypothetical protein